MPNQYTKAKELGLPQPTITENGRKRLSEAAKNRKWSLESREKLSRVAKERGLGGHTSKRKLHYVRKDGTEVFLQSSYEVKFATILDSLSIDWERPDPLNWLDSEGIYHRYYPDFKVGDIYVDTKNDYLAIVDRPKIEAVRIQNNVDLRIVTEKEITFKFIAGLV